MKLPKNVMYLLFFFLLLYSEFLRAGYTPQHGGDTWSIYLRVITISENSAATWVLNPLSFFGWYPYSYPTGEQMLLSAISQTTGLETDAVIYLSSTIFGLFGIFAMFILTRSIGKDDLFSVIAIITFASFDFVVNSTWNAVSQRALFIMLYPLAIYFLIKAYTTKEKRLTNSVLAVLSTVILASIHRIILLFIGTVVLPYFVLLTILTLKRKYHIAMSSRVYTASTFTAFIALFLLQVSGLTVIDLTAAEDHIKHILPGEGVFALSFNIGATYGTLYGLSAVLSPIGLFYLIQTKQATFGKYLFIIVSFASILFIMDVQYFLSFFPPVAAILTGAGIIFLLSLHRKGNKRLASAMWIVVLLISIQFFEWYVEVNRLAPLFIGGVGFFGVLYVVTHSFQEKRDGRKEIFAIMVSMLLISASFVVATIPMAALQHRNEYPNEGRILEESQVYTKAIWVREYAQGPFIADGAGIRNPIWAVSEVPSAASYFEVADNEVLKSVLKPEFNLSLIITDRQNAFDYDIPHRYNPKRIEWQVLSGEEHVASMYKVNFLIYSYKDSEFFQIYESAQERGFFFSDIRYPIYMDTEIQIFHYGNFE